jgi:hypothetical protein
MQLPLLSAAPPNDKLHRPAFVGCCVGVGLLLNSSLLLLTLVSLT